ncbi:hypothetical protein FACS189415_4300 [Bacteroidia bacterium]|nr:hypothetical protein FACS189415_4300 [Bacteroidia bacterium]
MNANIRHYLFLDYFLIFGIIALTGFEFFVNDATIIYFILLPVSLFRFIIEKKQISKWFIVFVVLLSMVFWGQQILFSLPFFPLITTIARFCTYFFIVAVVYDNFSKVFVNIVYCLCIISLFFYTLINISDSAYNFLLNISNGITPLNLQSESLQFDSNPGNNIIIYKIQIYNLERNSGPFWEPGQFAVFINIALALSIIINNKLFNAKNVIFIITSISTLSITSIVATLFILFYYFAFINRKIYSMVLLLILLLSVKPIYDMPFISEKVELYDNISDQASSRFGSHRLHFKQIQESPVVGHGFNAERNSDMILGEKQVSPNGLTKIFVFWGIPFAIIFYILYFKFSLISTNGNKKQSILLFITMLIVVFSQTDTLRHLYYLFAMFPLARTKQYKDKITS